MASSSKNAFELLSRACVSPTEYTLKTLYVALSVVAIASVSVVLLRIGWRHARQKSITSIGRLVEFLVVVQGTFDVIYHTVDLVFALDCNAPPLFTLLTNYSDNIYAKPTFAYNVAKEGFGYCSLLWHAHVAHCMYSWIVLKVSAIRLRRRRIPLLVLGTAAVMIARYYLYWSLRDGMLGLYLSTLIYDLVMVPATVAVMLRYYCLTMQALGEHSKSQEEEEQQQFQQLQQQQQRSLRQMEAGHEPQSVELVELRSAQRTPRPEGPSPNGSSGSQKAQSSSSLVDLPNPFHTSGPSQQQLGAGPNAGVRVGVGGSGGAGSPRAKKPKSNKNLLIIHRLMRISLSVSVVWLVLATLNIYTWAYFYRHGNVNGLRCLLILRLVFLRLIGTVDAIFLGDLFALCRPCTRSLRHALVRLRQKWEARSPLPLPFLNRFSSGISSLPSHAGSADSPAHTTTAVSRALAPASMGPPQHPEPRRFGFFGGRERAGSSLFSRSSGGEGSVVRPREECEEEAAAAARWAEELQRKRVPKRQLRNVEIFASTYNMGGMDRESCCVPSGGGAGDEKGGGSGSGGGGNRKSALQMIIPLWIPRGYDLYVIGVQECQILRELREAIVEHLGGPQAYTYFGQDIGSEVVLHGRIAVTLFVRAADVAQGRFKMHQGVVDRVAAGVSLGPLGKAENKGMVGLSCMYGDATLAVISAHFASDSHGRNKLAKRNAHACTTLRELSLHFENDCDAHLQHHHTIMLGDLNYRCMGTPNDVLSHLHRTARQLRELATAASEPSSLSSSPSNWRTLSYARLFEPFTPYRFPLEAPPPDLPRCLAAQGMRTSYTAAPYPLLGGASSVGWSGFSTYPGPTQDGASSSYASGRSSPRPLESKAAKSSASAAASVGSDEGKQRQARSGTPPPPPAPSRQQQQQQQQSSYVSSPLRNERPAASSSSAPSGASSVHSAGSWSTQQGLPLLTTGITAADNDDAWAWARQLDELSRSLRQRLVFYGFVEAPLHFPPSYRWNRVPAADYLLGNYKPGQGGLAGDHADEGRLRSAYSTVVPAKPGLLNRTLSRASSALSAGSGGGTAAGAAAPNANTGRNSPPPTPAALSTTKSTSSAVVGGTLRTPSWTDRVLTHSLPGKAPLLRWRAYDMADDVGLSDHRPVSSHLTLFVDADFPPFKGEDAGRGSAGLVLFTITIPRPPIVTQKKGSALLPSTSEVSILFPLTGEDPIAEQRKASSLGEVMPGFSHNHAALQGTASTTSSLSHFTLAPSTFPLRLRTVACPRRSEHLLLKINGREKEVGQVCVPLALFLPQQHPLAEPPAEIAAQDPATRAGLPTDATVDSGTLSCEEVVEGMQQARLLRGGGRGGGGGLRFPLTSGGAFKGWVQLEMRVRVRPLDTTD